MRFPLAVAWSLAALPLLAADTEKNPGDEVVVVYNSTMRESKAVADHYAAVRRVPANQVIGLKMPDKEIITRAEFREKIENPLRKEIERQKWIQYTREIRPATTTAPGLVLQRPMQAKIRYLVLCYGVPLRITADGSIVEPVPASVRPELRRNEAAVDNELALLPRDPKSYLLTGLLGNPLQGQTNASLFHPTNGLLMVTRLDGPTPEIARGLVDKAMAAESNGLWGRMYFDARSIADSNYAIGDAWIQGAATTARRVGYETILDTNAWTLPVTFPMSHIAVYMGWYDGVVTGPFALPHVEFMPGAFAYHLFSFSAATLRGTSHWVPALLAKGAACTVGYVEEPYLMGTINLHAFLGLWIRGFTYGEAVYGAMNVFSWQTTVVGDPLYRPFGSAADELHTRLVQAKSPMAEWSVLRAINQNILAGEPKSKFITLLERDPLARGSAVLQEKLAELYLADNRLIDGADTYLNAYRISRSPMQRQRITFEAQRSLGLLGREAKAAELLDNLLRENAAYPDKVAVLIRSVPLLRKQGKDKEAANVQAEIDRLAPPSPPASKSTNGASKP